MYHIRYHHLSAKPNGRPSSRLNHANRFLSSQHPQRRTLHLGHCCDGWYLVKNNQLNVIEERMPPGAKETRHRHAKAQQFFYVVKGEATLEIDGRILVLHAGEGALVPPGAAHQMQNLSQRDLEIIVTSQPPSHADREEAPPK